MVHRAQSLDAAPSMAADPHNADFVALPAPGWLEPTHFETDVSPRVGIARIIQAVQTQGGDIVEVKPHKCKVKCSVTSDHDRVQFHVSVFKVSPIRHVVEFQRRSGSGLVWHGVVSSLLDTLSDMDVSPSSVSPRPTKRHCSFALPPDTINPLELAPVALALANAGSVEARGVGVEALSRMTAALEHAGADVKTAVPTLENTLKGLQQLTDPSIQHCAGSALVTLAEANAKHTPEAKPTPAIRVPCPTGLENQGCCSNWRQQHGAVMLSSSA